jgi:integrase
VATFRTRTTGRGERRYQARVAGIGDKTFTNKKDAEVWAAEKEREKRLGEYFEAPPESFGALLDSFIARKKHGWRERTLEAKEQSAAKLKSLRSVPIARISYALLDDQIASIAVTAPRRAQMARDLALSVLKDAEHRGHKIDRRALTIPAPRYESSERKYLNVEELYELASFAPELANIILVAGFTGLRQGELFDLLDSDLDLESGTLNVRDGKTKAARRTVTLIPQAVKVFRAQLLSRPPGTSLVFPDAKGERQDRTRGFGKAFRAAREAAGLDGVRFHDLRHSYASLLIQASTQQEWGQAITSKVGADAMGHADGGKLFMATYGHLFPNAQKDAAAALGALVSEAR